MPLTDAPHARAVLATFVVNTISELGVTLALRADEEWYTLTTSPNVLRFELELGVEARRWPYNDDCFARARREGKPLWGHHAGFTDLFVPICNQSETWGILVAGPMATSRPTPEEVSLRWKWMGGQSSQPADSRFSDYLSATLATLTLDGADRNAFELLLRYLSQILSGEGEPAVFLPELTKLRESLREVRFAEKMWDAVRGMTDARTSHVWGTRFQAEDLWQLGLVAPPEHAAVGLLARAGDHVDPVADRIHRDQLQRACVALARKAGAACGRLGDHGIVFVADRHPVDLAKRAAEAGRKLGLTMHIGTEDASVVGLPARYESAHRAAEMALAHAAPLVTVKASASRRSRKLSALRRQILRDVQGRPRVLAARFEQYLEAVTALHGQDRLASRVALEVFLDHLGEILVAGGALDDKSLDEMESDLGRAVARTDTVNDIVAAYRRMMADVEAAMLKPADAHAERSVRRALDFIGEHIAEPLGLSAIARAAGFAPGYFSKLFKRRQGTTLEAYIRKKRIESAQHLLHNTKLNLEQVARLSGFVTRNHFHEVFKKAVGLTPIEYRERTWWSGESSHDRTVSPPRELIKATMRTGKRARR